ncbi:MAG: phosphatase PAP2 family protein [Deltaproteobacteria bacterium]|nr:MAG: phosphatase PAP2 family protein [Deltaproteobacteria bacterium]
MIMKYTLLLILLLFIQPIVHATSMRCQLTGDCPRTANRENPDFTLLNQDEFTSPLIQNNLIQPIDELQADGFSTQWSRPQYHIPLGLDGSDLITASVAAGALIIAFPNDQAITDFVQENSSDIIERVAIAGEFFGSELTLYGAGAGYIVGLVMQNGEVKSTSLLLAKTSLITGIIAQMAKRIFHRERPNQGNGPYVFHGPGFEGSHLSMPSGHTITAFTLATFISETWGHQSRLIPVLTYSAAAVGGWSRVHDNAHWTSDVIMGALIGHLVTKQILRQDSSKGSLVLSPTYDMEGNLIMGVHILGKREREQRDDYLFVLD